jgi:AbrB family looped-hinge helix DNA binding protein
MRITTKGQVTIPQHIREKLHLIPHSEVEFIEEKGRYMSEKRSARVRSTDLVGCVALPQSG